jgi:hypothetical protein
VQTGEEEHFEFDKTCAKTVCQAENDATPVSQACIDCYVWCGESYACGDATSVCAYECGRPACTDASACAEHAYVARGVAVSPTPGVADACVKAFNAFTDRCVPSRAEDSAEKIAARCNREAIFVSEAAIPYYACLGASACDDVNPHCEAPSTFGDELCKTIPECPSYCSDATREALNRVGSHLKPTFLAAARLCTREQSCKDVTACMQAWWKLRD